MADENDSINLTDFPGWRLTEEWRPITGYEGLYVVSDHGRIQSADTTIGGRGFEHRQKGRILKPWIVKRYLRVILYRDKQPTQLFLHRVVLTTFRGPPQPGHIGRHLDGHPLNCRLDNLAWGTVAENVADMHRHGRTARGERQGHAKMSEAKVTEMRQLHRNGGMTLTELGRRFGIHRGTVKKICLGEYWRHIP